MSVLTKIYNKIMRTRDWPTQKTQSLVIKANHSSNIHRVDTLLVTT